MKLRNLILGMAMVSVSLLSFAQLSLTTPITNVTSNDVGIFNAASYNYNTTVFSGSTGTGAYTISLYAPTITLADGRQVLPFGFTTVASQNVALPPITIGNPGSTTQETVTPSSASGCNIANQGAAAQGLCQITATFTYAHGRGELITSGDNGFQEAMNDASANAGGMVRWTIECGNITLSTSSATTTSTCLIPKDFTNLGGSVRVATTITTSASYSVGISGATASFISACTSLTAGLGCAGFQVTPTVVNGGAGTGALLITANATAGAGVVKVKVWGFTAAQSSW